MRKLIAIMTCHRKREWADAQRQTWVKDVVARGYADVRFFYGRPSSAGSAYVMHDDEVWLGGDDSYRGIPLKVQAIMRWAVEHCYDVTAKCDDDVYVVPERFPSLLCDMADYTGRFRTPYGKVYPVHFASGFFYWLRNRAMQVVADTSWNGDWMDERFVATALARRGMFGAHDDSYKVTGPHLPPSSVLQVGNLRHGTVFCEYGPKAMYAMHSALGRLGPVARTPLEFTPRMMVTDAILSSRPDDDIPRHKQDRSYFVN